MRWLVLCAVLLTAPVRGGVVWDEATDGDLSGDRLAPTAVTVALGSNQLLGTTIRNELDYVTFQVPAGAELSALVLDRYVSEDPVAFIAIQPGSEFTEPNNGTDPANLLGYLHLGEAHLGLDFLPDMGLADGAQGFTPPLPAGDYTLWIQQTGQALTEYTIDVQLTLVPEPSSLALAVGGLALGALMLRRRF